MRLLFCTDIHASPNHLKTLLARVQSTPVDGVIVGGDIVPHYLPQFCHLNLLAAQAAYLETVFIPALKQLKQRLNLPVYLDMGNDDLAGNRFILQRYDGGLFHLLHMRRVTLNPDMDLLGYMMVPPTPFNRKDWEKPDTATVPCQCRHMIRTEGFVTINGYLEQTQLDLDGAELIATDLDRLSQKITRPFILVSHSPPFNTPLDLTHRRHHVGSVAIHDFIAKWAAKGLLVGSLHGHIHESPQISGTQQTRIGPAVCINPGQSEGAEARLHCVLLHLDTRRSPPTLRLLS